MCTRILRDKTKTVPYSCRPGQQAQLDEYKALLDEYKIMMQPSVVVESAGRMQGG